jgi:hypothetical protein
LETLASYRPDPRLAQELAAIDGDDDFPRLGVVDPAWFDTRTLGIASARGEYADVGNAEWINQLRPLMMIGFDLNDFTAAHLHSDNRELTQAISRFVYDDATNYAGIHYLSKYGQNLDNWAIFERFSSGWSVFDLTVFYHEALAPDDPAFREALRIHGLQFG